MTSTGIVLDLKTINQETTLELNDLPTGTYVLQTEDLSKGQKVSQLIIKE